MPLKKQLSCIHLLRHRVHISLKHFLSTFSPIVSPERKFLVHPNHQETIAEFSFDNIFSSPKFLRCGLLSVMEQAFWIAIWIVLPVRRIFRPEIVLIMLFEPSSPKVLVLRDGVFVMMASQGNRTG